MRRSPNLQPRRSELKRAVHQLSLASLVVVVCVSVALVLSQFLQCQVVGCRTGCLIDGGGGKFFPFSELENLCIQTLFFFPSSMHVGPTLIFCWQTSQFY